MIDDLYVFFNKMGYHHPIHPTEVHMPIGLVVGAFIFALLAFIFRRQKLLLTPRHCIILAFLWVFPTMLLGYMDWQHFYGGAWIRPIKVKLTVAPSLAILLAAAIYFGRKYGAASIRVLPVYFLCFCAVVVLGYFGGQLVYGVKAVSSHAEYVAGQKIYSDHCNACHPGGGNVIEHGKPVINSPELRDFQGFLRWVRKPKAPMPPFSESRLSDADVKDLYEYIVHELNREPGSQPQRSAQNSKTLRRGDAPL
jgi:mono/diheme cytochrome c family protein